MTDDIEARIEAAWSRKIAELEWEVDVARQVLRNAERRLTEALLPGAKEGFFAYRHAVEKAMKIPFMKPSDDLTSLLETASVK